MCEHSTRYTSTEMIAAFFSTAELDGVPSRMDQGMEGHGLLKTRETHDLRIVHVPSDPGLEHRLPDLLTASNERLLGTAQNIVVEVVVAMPIPISLRGKILPLSRPHSSRAESPAP